MQTNTFLSALLVLLLGLGFSQEGAAQSLSDAPRFKTITIRTASMLALDKDPAQRIPHWLPVGTTLVETAREDIFWARIQPTENLLRGLRQSVSEDQLQQYLDQDWYFFDRNPASADGFDGDPTYLLANGFESRTKIEDDALVLTLKSEVDRSLWQLLRDDIEQGRVDVRCDVTLSGNRVLAEGAVAEWVDSGSMKIPLAGAADTQAGGRLTVAWRGRGVGDEASFYELRPAPASSPIALVAPTIPEPQESETETGDEAIESSTDVVDTGATFWRMLSLLLVLAFVVLLFRYRRFQRRSEKHLRLIDGGLAVDAVQRSEKALAPTEKGTSKQGEPGEEHSRSIKAFFFGLIKTVFLGSNTDGSESRYRAYSMKQRREQLARWSRLVAAVTKAMGASENGAASEPAVRFEQWYASMKDLEEQLKDQTGQQNEQRKPQENQDEFLAALQEQLKGQNTELNDAELQLNKLKIALGKVDTALNLNLPTGEPAEQYESISTVMARNDQREQQLKSWREMQLALREVRIIGRNQLFQRIAQVSAPTEPPLDQQNDESESDRSGQEEPVVRADIAVPLSDVEQLRQRLEQLEFHVTSLSRRRRPTSQRRPRILREGTRRKRR